MTTSAAPRQVRLCETRRLPTHEHGFRDPDFLELCLLVQRLQSLRSGRRAPGPGLTRALLRAPRLVGVVRRLPLQDVEVGSSPAAQHIRAFFRPRLVDVRHFVAVSALTLPADFDDYWRGRRRQALRTNSARAARAGVTVTRVEDGDDIRARMVDLFSRRDEQDGGSWYQERAKLGEGEFWFATTRDGESLAMAELIVDRRTALVRSMISSAGPARSDSRYLLMAEILASLCGRGVRHVLVGRALTLPPGLVYFQQRLGFDAVNLRLVDLRADES